MHGETPKGVTCPATATEKAGEAKAQAADEIALRADRVPSRSIAIYPTAGGRSFGMMITGAHRLIRGEGN